MDMSFSSVILWVDENQKIFFSTLHIIHDDVDDDEKGVREKWEWKRSLNCIPSNITIMMWDDIHTENVCINVHADGKLKEDDEKLSDLNIIAIIYFLSLLVSISPVHTHTHIHFCRCMHVRLPFLHDLQTYNTHIFCIIYPLASVLRYTYGIKIIYLSTLLNDSSQQWNVILWSVAYSQHYNISVPMIFSFHFCREIIFGVKFRCGYVNENNKWSSLGNGDRL